MENTLEKRFFKKVIKHEGCWEWTATKHKFGYGMIHPGGVGVKNKTTAHRVSWMIHFGPIPDGMHVLHKCDNPECTNPEHLMLGTNNENIRDRMHKDRSKDVFKGANRDFIRELYDLGASTRSLSRMFNVSRTSIKTALRKTKD